MDASTSHMNRQVVRKTYLITYSQANLEKFPTRQSHFPAPKTQYGKDICLEKDTPIFATSKYPIVYRGSYNACDDRETEMMAARWRLFEFHRHIPEAEQKEFKSCAHCFSKLVMLGSDPSSLK